MPYEFIKIKKEEGIGIVTIDRPPVNALSTKVIAELGEAFTEVENDPEIKVVILTGAGNYAFVAGADIKEIEEILKSGDLKKGEEMVRKTHEVLNHIENLKKPVICAINSLALGGGLELAMSTDIRIASDRAKLGAPEVQLGLIPGYGGTQRLPRLVGKAKGKELIFTGELISAQEALRIGLLNKVVPDGEELRAAKDMAKKIINKCAPLAVSAAKNAINQGLQQSDFNKALEIEAEALMDVIATEDLKEGITAFIQKRPPKYQGK